MNRLLHIKKKNKQKVGFAFPILDLCFLWLLIATGGIVKDQGGEHHQ